MTAHKLDRRAVEQLEAFNADQADVFRCPSCGARFSGRLASVASHAATCDALRTDVLLASTIATATAKDSARRMHEDALEAHNRNR